MDIIVLKLNGVKIFYNKKTSQTLEFARFPITVR